MRGAESQPHHYRQIEPRGLSALQSEHPAHDPVPSLEYPLRSFNVPSFGRVLRRIEITKPVRLRFHDVDVALGLRVKRVPLRSHAVAEQLAALFVFIPIQLMKLQ